MADAPVIVLFIELVILQFQILVACTPGLNFFSCYILTETIILV